MGRQRSAVALRRSPIVVAGGSRGTGELVRSIGAAQRREVLDADAIAGAHGVVIVPARSTRSIADQVRAIVDGCGERSVPIVLITGFSVGHGLAHRLNSPARLADRRAAEDVLRRSGLPYTIVRPTWLTNDPPGAYAIRLSQDPLIDGMIARADLATICLAALDEPDARAKTFAPFAEPGSADPHWSAKFAALAADEVAD